MSIEEILRQLFLNNIDVETAKKQLDELYSQKHRAFEEFKPIVGLWNNEHNITMSGIKRDAEEESQYFTDSGNFKKFGDY